MNPTTVLPPHTRTRTIAKQTPLPETAQRTGRPRPERPKNVQIEHPEQTPETKRLRKEILALIDHTASLVGPKRLVHHVWRAVERLDALFAGLGDQRLSLAEVHLAQASYLPDRSEANWQAIGTALVQLKGACLKAWS